MANRNGGFIGTDGLDAPDPPTAVTPTAGMHKVSVAFTAPTDTVAGGYVTSGSNFSNVMDYITIASTGNASDFGDLTQAVNGSSAVSDSTKWVRGGGSISGSTVNVMDDVTIASTGNAADFGDLTSARGRLGCTCGSHGGLQ